MLRNVDCIRERALSATNAKTDLPNRENLLVQTPSGLGAVLPVGLSKHISRGSPTRYVQSLPSYPYEHRQLIQADTDQHAVHAARRFFGQAPENMCIPLAVSFSLPWYPSSSESPSTCRTTMFHSIRKIESGSYSHLS
jgi:hypothetical protein